MTINERISKAIASTKKVIPNYFEKTLESRLANGTGSVTAFEDADLLEEVLKTSVWKPYSHENIMEGCEAFITQDIPGEYGLIELETLPKDSLVTLRDRKNTGKVSLEVSGTRGKKVSFTVLILGPEQNKEVVYTFHPGAPIRPSVTEMEPGMDGSTWTVAEALEKGFKTAKIV